MIARGRVRWEAKSGRAADPEYTSGMPSDDYLLRMLLGYLLTIAVETAVLLVGLTRRHPRRVKLFAGVWLTACTYPVVWLVLPPLIPDRLTYLLVAEVFAPAAECVLFWCAFARRLPRNARLTAADMVAITVANLCSFGLGEAIYAAQE
jgi:hypothetical protein